MLLDDIISYAGPKLFRSQTQRLIDLADLPETGRFELDRSVAAAVGYLAMSTDDDVFDKNIHLCRMPFPHIWIELESSSAWTAVMGTKYEPEEAGAFDDIPKRIGYLASEVQDERGRAIIVRIYWETRNKGLYRFSTTPIEIRIDMSPEPMGKVPAINVEDKMALARCEFRVAEDCREPLRLLVPELVRAQLKFQPDYDQETLMMNFLNDAAGEWKFVLSLLMFVNTKNGASIEEPSSLRRTMRKRNPATDRRRPIQIIVMRDRRIREALRDRRTSGEAAGALVRGHLKVRRTGVFWWSFYRRSGGRDHGNQYRLRA